MYVVLIIDSEGLLEESFLVKKNVSKLIFHVKLLILFFASSQLLIGLKNREGGGDCRPHASTCWGLFCRN